MNFILEDVRNWRKDELYTVNMCCACEEGGFECSTDIRFCDKCHTMRLFFDYDIQTFVELRIINYVIVSIGIETPCSIEDQMSILVDDQIFWDCPSEKKLVSNIDMLYTFIREFMSSSLCSFCSDSLDSILEKFYMFECFRQLFIGPNTCDDIVIEI